MGEIVIVGLGPGDEGLITLAAWQAIEAASPLLLRTVNHPSVQAIIAKGIPYQSYDSVYDSKPNFDEVYHTIAVGCIKRAAKGEKVIYAVPGSPLVAEKTVVLIRAMAAEQNIKITILPGMSFLELVYSRLGIDPVEGLTIVDAADIAKLPSGCGQALVITQVYDRHVASEVKLLLMELYADDYGIKVMTNLGLADEEILVIPLYELDRLTCINHLTSIYVPPKELAQGQFSLDPLTDVMARLRSPGGCIWDIEQTHLSLRRYIIEEVYEVLEAIDLSASDKLCEELGDLLLQIVFHARIAEECGHFSMQDVINTVTEKLIRRHPHVFGDISVRDAAEVVMNWDLIKKREQAEERKFVLDGIPHGLPSLVRAYKIQAKAAKVGFDWDTIQPVWAKVYEELTELKEAVELADKEWIEGELGDLLFAVVNLARFLGLDAEVALNVTNNKFINRFNYVEKRVLELKVGWENVALAELDKLWDEAKQVEIKSSSKMA